MSDKNELRYENFLFLTIMDIFTIGEHSKYEFEDLYICLYKLLKKDLIKKIKFSNFSFKDIEKDAQTGKKKDIKDKLLSNAHCLNTRKGCKPHGEKSFSILDVLFKILLSLFHTKSILP